MSAILAATMAEKEWTPAEVRELAALAKKKGINKKTLAEEYIKCTPIALSYWMNEESGKSPSGLAQGALSYAEIRLKKMKDKE